MLRYRLYDLDIVLNRVLVYTTLSAMTAAVYLAIVVLAEVVAGWGHGLGVQIAATIVAAALFQPLRTRVQHGVDRLLFGDRARPYDALTPARPHASSTRRRPTRSLAGVVASVAEALRVPYAASSSSIADGTVTAAEHGRRAASWLGSR